jgi:CheY-like chemotaxis protein
MGLRVHGAGEQGGGQMNGLDSQGRIPFARTARLLVVDDEPQIGNTLRLLLQPECDVSPTTSARAALARIQAGERFDVIFCDLMMPEMSGMDFHASLLEKNADQADRVVFMTGGVYTASSREFLERMSDRCIEKPFDMAQLRALIASRVR